MVMINRLNAKSVENEALPSDLIIGAKGQSAVGTLDGTFHPVLLLTCPTDAQPLKFQILFSTSSRDYPICLRL